MPENKAALLEIRRALGCPAWTSVDDVVVAVQRLAERVNSAADLLGVLRDDAEAIQRCALLFRAKCVEGQIKEDQMPPEGGW